mmetsp:Transcript_30966/g.89176  ORF Transcript_30966/g.89176 Transcript_30966/m.89176 type:complete len:133 (+) Transcript_30966:1503-1901(+)
MYRASTVTSTEEVLFASTDLIAASNAFMTGGSHKSARKSMPDTLMDNSTWSLSVVLLVVVRVNDDVEVVVIDRVVVVRVDVDDVVVAEVVVVDDSVTITICRFRDGSCLEVVARNALENPCSRLTFRSGRSS